jgi:DNA-binding NarL/FixJ family response regulator
MTPERIKVLIADRQELTREAFKKLLEEHPALDVVGVAGDGEEVLRKAHALRPGVLILDADLPRLGGLEVTKRLRGEWPQMGIVLFFSQASGEAEEFLRDGPGGKACLLRDSVKTVESLVRTVLDVAEGRTILDPLMARRVVAVGGQPLNQLTEREKEVLRLMAEGYSNGTIGQLLFLQPKTIEYHINHIFSKLNVAGGEYHARVQAVLTYLHTS